MNSLSSFASLSATVNSTEVRRLGCITRNLCSLQLALEILLGPEASIVCGAPWATRLSRLLLMLALAMQTFLVQTEWQQPSSREFFFSYQSGQSREAPSDARTAMEKYKRHTHCHMNTDVIALHLRHRSWFANKWKKKTKNTSIHCSKIDWSSVIVCWETQIIITSFLFLWSFKMQRTVKKNKQKNKLTTEPFLGPLDTSTVFLIKYTYNKMLHLQVVALLWFSNQMKIWRALFLS